MTMIGKITNCILCNAQEGDTHVTGIADQLAVDDRKQIGESGIAGVQQVSINPKMMILVKIHLEPVHVGATSIHHAMVCQSCSKIVYNAVDAGFFDATILPQWQHDRIYNGSKIEDINPPKPVITAYLQICDEILDANRALSRSLIGLPEGFGGAEQYLNTYWYHRAAAAITRLRKELAEYGDYRPATSARPAEHVPEDAVCAYCGDLYGDVEPGYKPEWQIIMTTSSPVYFCCENHAVIYVKDDLANYKAEEK